MQCNLQLTTLSYKLLFSEFCVYVCNNVLSYYNYYIIMCMILCIVCNITYHVIYIYILYLCFVIQFFNMLRV